MTIHPLGTLKRDPEVEQWLRSQPVAVPYFGGLQLPFVLSRVEEDPAPPEFESAIQAFLSLGSSDREQAGKFVFQLYRQFVDSVGEDELDFSIPSPSAVWEFVTPTRIHVSRRRRRNQLVYVAIDAECQWEIEHGLMVIYRCGSTLTRVSEQDGHLTTSDAFDLPEQRDAIIYEG